MPKPLDRFAILVMIALCVIWGGNQVATKIALHDFPPMAQCALRNGIGAVLVALYAGVARPETLRRDGAFWLGVAAGLLFTLEFVFLFFALERTTAASAVVFLFTAPFFVALGAVVLLPSETLSRRQWAGVALAFAGVALGFYRPTAGSNGFGDVLALLAGAAWGATTLLIKATRLRAIDPLKTLLYQVAVAALVTAALALWSGEPVSASPSAASIAALIYQGALVTGVTYLIWFWLLQHYRAPELSALTFLSPIVGVFAGWAALGERPGPIFVLALVGVALGIALLSWPARALAGAAGARQIGR